MKAEVENSHLREIAFVFLKLGTTAFGGPAAHIAMMNNEFVIKRGWITQEQFLDLLSATNFIPGPNSTEMAIHIGHSRGGWKGLIVAGICFILPAALIVTAFAWLYLKYGSLPAAQTILYGIKPVLIAVVFQAIWSLSKSAVKNKFLAALGVSSLLANFLGLNELAVIALCGVIALLMAQMKAKGFWSIAATPQAWKPVGLLVAGSATLASTVPITLGKIFLFFVKIGSVLFGSGYVLLAFLRTDLVDNWHWLTESQLLDAVAVGQLTPGPVFTTATFIGYLLAGFKGATLATVGIFLPAFLFVGLTAPLVRKMRKSLLIGSLLDGVNVGSLAVMTVTCVFLGQQSLIDLPTFALALVSGFLLIRFKINSAWLVLLGGAAGFLLH
jgi:chromate transporter